MGWGGVGGPLTWILLLSKVSTRAVQREKLISRLFRRPGLAGIANN